MPPDFVLRLDSSRDRALLLAGFAGHGGPTWATEIDQMIHVLPAVRRLPSRSAQSRPRPVVLPLALAALLVPLSAAAQLLPWVGLAGEHAQLLSEEIRGGHGPGPRDHCGYAVGAGDFNNDGADDLAVGIPGQARSAGFDCGLAQVRFGRPMGGVGSVLTLDPAAPGAPDPAEIYDECGSALAVGDFNASVRARGQPVPARLRAPAAALSRTAQPMRPGSTAAPGGSQHAGARPPSAAAAHGRGAVGPGISFFARQQAIRPEFIREARSRHRTQPKETST